MGHLRLFSRLSINTGDFGGTGRVEGFHNLARQGHHWPGTRGPCWIVTHAEATCNGYFVTHGLGLAVLILRMQVGVLVSICVVVLGGWVVLKLPLHFFQV